MITLRSAPCMGTVRSIPCRPASSAVPVLGGSFIPLALNDAIGNSVAILLADTPAGGSAAPGTQAMARSPLDHDHALSTPIADDMDLARRDMQDADYTYLGSARRA